LPIFEHGEHLPFDTPEHPARMDGRWVYMKGCPVAASGDL
jgi:hypothetical protein